MARHELFTFCASYELCYLNRRRNRTVNTRVARITIGKMKMVYGSLNVSLWLVFRQAKRCRPFDMNIVGGTRQQRIRQRHQMTFCHCNSEYGSCGTGSTDRYNVGCSTTWRFSLRLVHVSLSFKLIELRIGFNVMKFYFILLHSPKNHLLTATIHTHGSGWIFLFWVFGTLIMWVKVFGGCLRALSAIISDGNFPFKFDVRHTLCTNAHFAHDFLLLVLATFFPIQHSE